MTPAAGRDDELRGGGRGHRRGRWGRLAYRLYRNPVVLFVLGPAYLFFLQNRLPVGLMTAGVRYWISAMGTNAVIAMSLGLMVWLGGFMPLLLIYIPTSVVAGTLGVWLFYVQHQFEETHWAKGEDWQLHDAALAGSSHYVLPQPLQWLSPVASKLWKLRLTTQTSKPALT